MPSGVSKVLNNLRLTADLQGFYHDGTCFPANAVSPGPLHPQRTDPPERMAQSRDRDAAIAGALYLHVARTRTERSRMSWQTAGLGFSSHRKCTTDISNQRIPNAFCGERFFDKQLSQVSSTDAFYDFTQLTQVYFTCAANGNCLRRVGVLHRMVFEYSKGD
jgi:hypothetical protein